LVNAKALIVASFAVTVALGVAGVILYYQQLEPLRLVANSGPPGAVLDRVTYLEYTARDLQGNEYTIRLYNDPAARSGRGELYSDGELLYVIHYRYDDNGLVAAWKTFPNGTLAFNYTGGFLLAAEEAFFTGLNYTLDQAGANVLSYEPFPGAAPVYAPQYLAPYLNIDWNYYASIVKPRTQPGNLVTVNLFPATVNYLGREVNGIVVSIVPNVVNPPNKWAATTITFSLVADSGLAVVASWSYESIVGGVDFQVSYNLTDASFTP